MKLMEMPNVICMVGNHELMALECMECLIKEITDMSIEELDEENLDNLVTWQYNGSKSTIDEFIKLDLDTKQEVLDFIKEFLIYEEVSINNKDNPNPGFIYRHNNHIAIDCGAHYPSGRLAAICLDTGEEYYSSPNGEEKLKHDICDE